jgi:sortase A
MRIIEFGLWTCGILLAVLFFATQAWAEFATGRDLDQFEQEKQHALYALGAQRLVTKNAATARLEPAPVAATGASAISNGDLAIAVLRIPAAGLVVPVGRGTSEPVLLRGAGLIEGSAQPGSAGNVALAAHRDTHFRALKDVTVGDLIELESLDVTQSYRISDLSVVDPSAVHVLAEVGEPVLTLVTCYPFYFVGHAPQRFIVRAVAAGDPRHHP